MTVGSGTREMGKKPAMIVSAGGSGTLRCYGGKACGSRRLSEIARRVCSCAVETGCYGGPEQKRLLSLKKRKGERQRSNHEQETDRDRTRDRPR